MDHRLRAEAEIAAERLNGVPRAATGARADDHKWLTSAREAAEALFAGSREATTPIREDSAAIGKSARKPRVLPVLLRAAAPQEELNKSNSPKHQIKPKIASSELARIRTWLKYGMTLRQVAEMYGVDVEEIESILRGR